MSLSISEISSIVTSYLDKPQEAHHKAVWESIALSQIINCQTQPSKPSRGKKLENLLILKDYFNKKPLKGVAIPHLFAIDRRIEQIFQDLPQISAEWQRLEALYQKTPREQFWKLAEPTLKLLQAAIIDCFSQEGIIERLFTQSDLEQLQQLKTQGATVIDRSNSNEDASAEDAAVNAGGNETIGGVQPEPKEVTSATARVVASYFSMTSLKNRSFFGSPFQKLPSLSAIIMQQVIEKPGSIPVSGVMMTSKPTFVDNKRMRITTVNAVYGFGKGVVENVVTADSANIIRSAADPTKLDIYYENRLKRDRLVCDGTDVVRKPNDPASQLIPALTQNQLERLYLLGQEIEECFGRPMDVEFVIQDDIIYVVQARDIKAKSAQSPSFVDSNEQGLPCETIVAGNSEVMVFRDPSELLITANLEEAEKAFQPGNHRAVISYAKDAEDSHFAINFASMRPPIPCFYMEEEAIQKLKDHLGQTLTLCPQTGRILVGEGQIRKGWFSHPTGIKSSLEGVVLKSTSNDAPIHPAFRELKLGNAPQALEMLQTHFFTSIQKLVQNAQYKKPYFCIVASKLAKAVQREFREIRACIDHPESHSRLEMLFHTRMLENLFTGSQGKNGKTLGSHSLQSLEKERASYRLADAFLAKNPDHPNADLVSLAASYPSEELTRLWCEFLEKAPPSDKLREILVQVNDLLPTWLLCCFFPAYKTSQNAEECLAKLESFTSKDQQFIAAATDQKERAQAIQERFDKATSKKEIEAAWGDLVQLTQTWKHPDEDASLLSVMAACASHIELIQAYNSSVQRVKTCAFLAKPEIEQMVEKRTMAFLNLLQIWASGSLGDTRFRLVEEVLTDSAHVESTLKHEVGTDANFVVADWLITENIPETKIQCWDQLLTCVHQNLLLAISQHLSSYISRSGFGMQTLPLPPLLEQFSKQVQEKFQKLQQTGFRVEEKGIGIRWNLPLAVHSMNIDAFYDWRLQKLVLSIQVNGWMEGRGNNMRDYAYMAGEIEKIATSDKPLQSEKLQYCRFIWMLDDLAILPRVLSHLDFVGKLSFKHFGLSAEDVEVIYKELHQINPEFTDDRLAEIVIRDPQAQDRCPSLFTHGAIHDFLKYMDAQPLGPKERTIAQLVAWQRKLLLAGKETVVFPLFSYLSKQECLALLEDIARLPNIESRKSLSLIDPNAPEQQEKVEAITKWVMGKLEAKDPGILNFTFDGTFVMRQKDRILPLLNTFLFTPINTQQRNNLIDILYDIWNAFPDTHAAIIDALCKAPRHDWNDLNIINVFFILKNLDVPTEETRALTADLLKQIGTAPDDSLNDHTSEELSIHFFFQKFRAQHDALVNAAILRLFIRDLKEGKLRNLTFKYLTCIAPDDKAEAMRHLIQFFRTKKYPGMSIQGVIPDKYLRFIDGKTQKEITQLLKPEEEVKANLS